MRPIRLQLKNFTAFRDPQEVDFTDFDVFAIAGPTGSGKSSLLDAITYALFGSVERVGKHVGQLVSQGQPRMAVVLEFDVNGDRYRVTRSTPSGRGATKILLERRAGDDWQSAGDGADRVRECDAMIRRVIGLDYVAFTRSVLLPQGRFAEFLNGEAGQRRSILIELLGLSLFKRMAERAGSIAKESSTKADAKAEVLDAKFAGATPEALEEAQRAAERAAERERRLAAAEKQVGAAAANWQKTLRRVDDVEACARDAHEAAVAAAAAETRLRCLASHAAEAEAAMREAAGPADLAREASERATAERERAEAEWGGEADLAASAARAESLADLVARTAEAREALAAAEAAVPAAAELVARTEAAANAAEAQDTEATDAAARAAEALKEAQHLDLVAAVTAGMKAGDPCPVCGEPLAKSPARAPASALAKATKALAAREAGAGKAAAALAARRRDLDRSAQAAEQAGKEVVRCAADLDRRERDLLETRDGLAAVFPDGKLPADPAAALKERLSRVGALRETERVAAADVLAYDKVLADARRAIDGIDADVGAERARLEARPLDALVKRARVCAGEDTSLDGLDPVAGGPGAGAEAIGAEAARLVSNLGRLASDLEQVAAKHRAGEAGFLAEAEAAVDDLLPSPGTLQGLEEAVGAARLTAAAEAATQAQLVERIRDAIETRSALAAEIDELRTRGRAFRALAGELRADHLVAFLQSEALQVLAAAGSERLARLSDGRYRLVCEDDEFSVVDTWNGDERRSVRTLSGGETFLASLALALALSEQVRSLSVTERARLDSLFLDEGFGTLDPESLRVVVEAIEQLGGDGRLVGVITHVAELAEQFPRIQVEKSPRGSRLRLEV